MVLNTGFLLLAQIASICNSLPQLVGQALIRPYVRSVSDPAPDPIYIENQARAQNVFRDWWTQPNGKTYKQTLIEGHKAALANPHYQTVNTLNDPKASKQGEFNTTNVQTSMHPVLRELEEMKFEPKNPSIEVSTRGMTGNKTRIQYRWKISIPGIPESDGPLTVGIKRDSSGGWLEMSHYFFPSEGRTQVYLKAMEAELKAMKDLESSARVDAEARKKYLNHLSIFYQLGVNLRPFQGTNNSLLMGQVNVLLEQVGLPSVVHGHLDYYAMVYDHSDFAPLFVSHILTPR